MLLTLDIVFRSNIVFSDHAVLDASRVLTMSAKTFKTAPLPRQARYALTLTHALEAGSYGPLLRKACVIVSKWPSPTSDTDPKPPADVAWLTAMTGLFEAVGRADEDVRADVWWSIVDVAADMDVEDASSCRRIQHLLTPIPDRLSTEQIKSILPVDTVAVWRHGTINVNSRGKRLVKEGLDRLENLNPDSGRKRKRDLEKEENLRRMLKKDLPDLDFQDGKDVLPILLGQIRR